ncbi:MAG: organic hydroperoxide resistance protein [Brevundimonas sp.]|nr:MAG: organic hydroperoxide resistance protein [Brevundimonas sp.]
MSDTVYSAHAHTVGGRGGAAKSDDGKLDVKLAYPPALGGDGNGTNPEQLFAAGYGACFTGALGLVARNEKVTLGEHSVDVTVDLIKDDPSFKIGVTLTLNAPGLDREQALDLLHKAHEVCPYSKATRNNVDVKLDVA